MDETENLRISETGRPGPQSKRRRRPPSVSPRFTGGEVEVPVVQEEVPPSQPPPAMQGEEARFTVGTWRGRTQWRCAQCPWDTLDGEAAMLEHIAARHTPRVRRVALPLVGPDGKPITKEVIDG